MLQTKSNPTNTPAVIVGTSLSTLVDLSLTSMGGDTFVQFINTGAVALTDLQMQVSVDNVNFYKFAGVADWANFIGGSVAFPYWLKGISTTAPGTLGAAGKTWLVLDLSGLPYVQFQAQVGSSTTNVSTAFSGQSQRR